MTWKLDPERLSQLDAFGFEACSRAQCAFHKQGFTFLLNSNSNRSNPILLLKETQLNGPLDAVTVFRSHRAKVTEQCRHADHIKST